LLALLFGLEVDPRYRLVTGVGTWLATVIFFRRPLLALLRERTEDARTIALASVGLIGVSLAVGNHPAAWGREPLFVGAGLLFTAVVVGSAFWAPEGDHDHPSSTGALLFGLVQGVAALPGLSRPAVAVVSLLWLGVRADRAFELSFLAAIPAGLFAIVLACLEPGDLAQTSTSSREAVTLVLFIMMTVSVALTSLHLLRAAVRQRALPAFSLYLVPLAVATLAWGYARP
jgi:undecaprenyl-diphosphatase